MKTEHFDDSIRRKIENINVSFRDEDIEKVHKYVKLKRAARFRQRYGLLVITSLGLLIIAILFKLNFVQHEEKNQLLQTIDTLRGKLAKSEVNSMQVKTDTVYVKEYISKPSDNREYTETNNNVFKDKPVGRSLIQKEKSFSKNDSSTNQVSGSKINSSGEESNRNNQMTHQNKTMAQQIFNQEINHSEKKNNDNDKTLSENDSYLKQIADNSANESKNSGKENNNNKMPAISDELSIKDTVGLSDSVAKQNNPIALNDHPDQFSDTISDNKYKHGAMLNFIKNWDYQAGFELEKANGPLGYSILGRILFTNKWSLSTGVKLLTINNEKYDDDGDFHQQNGQDFQSAYEPHVSDTSFISNIEIHNTLFQIPIILTYQFALKNNFALLFGLSTDMDLSSKQTINYKYFGINYAEEHKNFEIKYSPTLFNNIALSIGLQKQWNHFAVQVSPFISRQLSPVICKKEDLYYGANAGVFYAFGK
jgi:hypothetical protein